MADNTVINTGAGGDVIATDELTTLNGGAVSGVKAQRVKVGFGTDAIFRDVDASNGLPVVGTFFQATQPISAGSLPLPTGASTETTLAALNTKVTAVNTGAVTISAALPTGANKIGTVDIATAPATAKGTQGANALPTQDLKDAGRNQTNYFMSGQVLSTGAEVLQSLLGYKSGAGVVATTTPAVVTTGKTYRINRIAITYVAVATAGSILVSLRANPAGVVALGSPLVDSWLVGANAVAAGVAETIVIDIPDGIEFAAGTGIGVGVIGQSAVGAAAATGYAKVSVSGYEY